MPTPAPDHWGNLDVDVVDLDRGIYLAPAGLRDNRVVVLWHRCSGVGPSPRWLGTPFGEEVIVNRSPWTLSVAMECAACGLDGVVREGRWVEVPAQAETA